MTSARKNRNLTIESTTLQVFLGICADPAIVKEILRQNQESIKLTQEATHQQKLHDDRKQIHQKPHHANRVEHAPRVPTARKR